MDRIRGVNPDSSIKNSVVLYGAAPYDGGGGLPYRPVDVQPFVPTPMPTAMGGTITMQPYKGTKPGETDTAEAMVERIKHRIAWLENELRMHENWRTELELLRKMLAAADSVSNTGGSNGG